MNRLSKMPMMLMTLLTTLLLATRALSAEVAEPGPAADPIGVAVTAYFKTAFERLQAVAEKQPTPETLRSAMKPLADETEGFFGGTLIDTNFVIRQVYFQRDFLARGYDLKKVKQLTFFWEKMREKPMPQLSEPAHGNVLQPRLIALRYPVLNEGKLVSVVSIMIRTEAFLKATGLDRCKGYRITCRGAMAEEEGRLTPPTRSVAITLPSTDWLIEYTP